MKSPPCTEGSTIEDTFVIREIIDNICNVTSIALIKQIVFFRELNYSTSGSGFSGQITQLRIWISLWGVRPAVGSPQLLPVIRAWGCGALGEAN